MVCFVEVVVLFAVVDVELVVCLVPLVHVPFTGSQVLLTHWLQLSRQFSPYVPIVHSGTKRNKNHIVFLELVQSSYMYFTYSTNGHVLRVTAGELSIENEIKIGLVRFTK